MVERTQPNLSTTLTALRVDAASVPIDERRAAVRAVADAVLQGCLEDDATAAEILDLLARDPEWAVRLDVARMLHLLDDDICSRLAAQFRQDCNNYVRSHAERNLSRQRKARKTANRRRIESRGYTEQVDGLTQQYGKRVAAKVQALADQRFAMLTEAVVHDVRRILTTLAPNVAALRQGTATPERLASIAEDVAFLKHTVDAVEQFSKPLPDQRHPEDLQPIIQQACERARACLVEQGHDPAPVEVAVADVPAVRPRVARRLIVMALTNVIQNAMEAFAVREVDTLRPGKIEVQVVVDGFETRIFVRDNAPGIEPEVVARLMQFTPLGPNRYKRNSSGWGLSLVNKYITAHGGQVVITSEMDRGTSVVLVLPMRDLVEGGVE
jgi:signal transduction histidine kinase